METKIIRILLWIIFVLVSLLSTFSVYLLAPLFFEPVIVSKMVVFTVFTIPTAIGFLAMPIIEKVEVKIAESKLIRHKQVNEELKGALTETCEKGAVTIVNDNLSNVIEQNRRHRVRHRFEMMLIQGEFVKREFQWIHMTGGVSMGGFVDIKTGLNWDDVMNGLWRDLGDDYVDNRLQRRKIRNKLKKYKQWRATVKPEG